MPKDIELLHKLYSGPKSTREIARAYNVGHSYVHRRLKVLEWLGLVEKEGGRGFKLTDAGKALVEKEKVEAGITLEQFIGHIQRLIELRAKVKGDKAAKQVSLLGLRYVLDGLALFTGELVQRLADEISPEKMGRLLDEAYSKTLKELIASAAIFCIGLDASGWNLFHMEMVNIILRLQGCGLQLQPYLEMESST